MNNITLGDIILFLTLLAIIWYTIETLRLRKWQQRQVYLSTVEIYASLLMHSNSMFVQQGQVDNNLTELQRNLSKIVKDIYEKGHFDPRVVFGKTY